MKLEADPEQQVITTWQVHTNDQSVLPGMLAKSFVGQSFASPLCPPAQVEVLHQFRCHVKVEVLHLFRCFTHTYTHLQSSTCFPHDIQYIYIYTHTYIYIYVINLKVLRPYFWVLAESGTKKGSSPRNHSNATDLRPRVYSNSCWIPRPRVYSNVIGSTAEGL